MPNALGAAAGAGIAQLAERELPKLEVAGSNPVARSNYPQTGVDLTMSMFTKKPEQESQVSPASPAPRPASAARPSSTPPAMPAATGKSSFLGSGCVFEGKFSGGGSFECRGEFEGVIDVEGDVVIGHGGSAKAELNARRINIEGRLQGDVTGTEKVEVGTAGHVEGDVRAPAVQFAEGAFFEGNVEMRRGKAAASDDEASNSSEGQPELPGSDTTAS